MVDREQRLREWSIDELHLVRSVRHHEPVYRNPGELRGDVRWLLAELTMVRKALAATTTDDVPSSPVSPSSPTDARGLT